MAKIAVMGYGTIGSGVVEALSMNQESITKKAGEPIEVKYVLDLREFPGSPIEDKLIKDYQIIVNDPEVSVVVETMGGVEPANTFVKAMLEKGKSVATSNKALVAACGTDLMETAVANNCNFMFEASVGGGIPIIRPLYNCLTPDVISEIAGVLNGTTNYILTKMNVENESFEECLKQAQALGYAEKDPSADVNGDDTCRKIAILTSIATGKRVDYTKIHTEGIARAEAADFRYAELMDMSIKLMGLTRLVDGHLKCMVAPYMVDRNHPLYPVEDVFNGVMVTGNVVDRLLFFGRGAGKLPTAAAVVADVIEEVKLKDNCQTIPWSREELVPDNYLDYKARFMIRIPDDVPEEEYQKIFRPEKVLTGILPGEIAMITSKISEAEYLEMEKACDKIMGKIRMY